ncbi:MAG: hypothetical protein OQL28_07800 [Sedimenticola sp.]|nr:hypothetical protein [Sedimenticola sp.]
MKKIIITALVSLFAIGTASADYSGDIQNDSIYASSESTADFTRLPATAAGRSEMTEVKNFGGMQDHPNERVSGI